MTRRRRASMREGPLADLFRSTSDDPEQRSEAGEAEREHYEDEPYPPDYEGAGGEPAAGEPDFETEETGDDSGFEAPESAGRRSPEPADRQPTEGPETEADEEEEEGPLYGRDIPDPGRAGSGAAEPGTTDRPRQAEPSERLSRVFTDDSARDERPRYGREESYGGGGVSGPHSPVIRVVGVGGGGVNAINRMVEAQIPGVEFMAINTDLQSLQLCIADSTVHIGSEQTRGLGAGSDADVGFRAAFAEQDRIKRLLKGSDMVFVAAGSGGGTGTGAAPVVARLAREVGALTVGIVTRPFSFEGTQRGRAADEGIDELGKEVDTLIVVPNDRLLEVLDQQTSIVEAFQVADDVLRQGVQGVSDLVTLPALINLDFADVRTIMAEAGQALLGIGMGAGDGRAEMAAQRAISSPLLETSMKGARAILLSITGGSDLSLIEVSEAASVVNDAAHPDANIIFGANVDEELEDQVWVTVVATRFDTRSQPSSGSGESGSRRERPQRGEDSGSESRSHERPRRRSDRGSDGGNLDVPEFLPD